MAAQVIVVIIVLHAEYILAVEITIIAMRMFMVVIVAQSAQMDHHTVQVRNVTIVAFCVM